MCDQKVITSNRTLFAWEIICEIFNSKLKLIEKKNGKYVVVIERLHNRRNMMQILWQI